MDAKKGPELKLVDPVNDQPHPDGVFWDKEAPTTPPTPMRRNIPPHLGKVLAFFSDIIADEGLLLDLCVDKATAIIEFNCKKRMVGTDLIGEAAQMHPFNVVAAATPIAVELYKNVLASIGQRKEEYDELLRAAQEELKSGTGKSSIILPR